jgi:hypothetical protein
LETKCKQLEYTNVKCGRDSLKELVGLVVPVLEMKEGEGVSYVRW